MWSPLRKGGADTSQLPLGRCRFSCSCTGDRSSKAPALTTMQRTSASGYFPFPFSFPPLLSPPPPFFNIPTPLAFIQRRWQRNVSMTLYSFLPSFTPSFLPLKHRVTKQWWSQSTTDSDRLDGYVLVFAPEINFLNPRMY